MDHTELRRTGKFLLFSCSAGLIELGSFALFNEVFHWPHWAAYLTALVLSVLWNFTCNRRYTFRSSEKVARAMALVFFVLLRVHAAVHAARAPARGRAGLERLSGHVFEHGAEFRDGVSLPALRGLPPLSGHEQTCAHLFLIISVSRAQRALCFSAERPLRRLVFSAQVWYYKRHKIDSSAPGAEGTDMKTAIVTDGKYRSSIAAVRALHRAGYQVIVTQTRADVHAVPAVAASRCCAVFRWIDGAAADDSYADRLAALLETYDRPVLFCVGAVTLNTVAAQRERFARVADFLIAPRPVLDALNDKETVHARAQSLGIPVPRQYDGVPPERYPVVIKPHCGEKFGLKAADRYAVADTPEAYAQILARMQRYDPAPIVQDRITGPGIGVSLLLGRDGCLICALCHRRIREYPVTGGPSTCCELLRRRAH